MKTKTVQMTYCRPGESGLARTAEEVAERLERLLIALDGINGVAVSGGILEDVQEFRNKIITRCQMDAWRFVAQSDRWSVRRPVDYAGGTREVKTHGD